MDAKVFSEIARYQADKHVHVPVFNGERTKVLLLCLSGGLSVPPHSHPGFEVTLQPLLGRAVLPGEDGKELLERLQQVHPGSFPEGQLRTLQRRVKIWRHDLAHQMVFGVKAAEGAGQPGAIARIP